MNVNKVPKVPGSPVLSALLKIGVIGGLGAYSIANSIYNVDGGHRAIVFNRVTGIKEKVCIVLWSFSVACISQSHSLSEQIVTG